MPSNVGDAIFVAVRGDGGPQPPQKYGKVAFPTCLSKVHELACLSVCWYVHCPKRCPQRPHGRRSRQPCQWQVHRHRPTSRRTVRTTAANVVNMANLLGAVVRPSTARWQQRRMT